MSRIGKAPVSLPGRVDVAIDGTTGTAQGGGGWRDEDAPRGPASAPLPGAPACARYERAAAHGRLPQQPLHLRPGYRRRLGAHAGGGGVSGEVAPGPPPDRYHRG